MNDEEKDELLIRIDEGLNGKDGLHTKVDNFQAEFKETVDTYLPTWIWAKSTRTWLGRISMSVAGACVIMVIVYFIGKLG